MNEEPEPLVPTQDEQDRAFRWARSISTRPRNPQEMADLIARALAEYRQDIAPGFMEHHIKLSVREAQVLQGIVEGKDNIDIAKVLYISENTVKTHNRRLFKKLNAVNRQHSVTLAFRYGLAK